MARWDALGPKWAARSAAGWEEVWRGTGAKAPSVVEKGGGGWGDVEETEGREVRDAEEAEEERRCTERRRAANPEEEAGDRHGGAGDERAVRLAGWRTTEKKKGG